MPELVVGQPLETTEAVLSVENVPSGTHVFELRVEDDSGNLSQPARVVVMARGAAPRVTSFEPEFGLTGDRVLLRASGLTGDSPDDHKVRFNGVRARIVGGSSRTVHALVPENAESGPVTLISSTGQGVSDTPFYIPRRRLLLLRGAREPCFGGRGDLLAALTPEGNAVAVWGLGRTTFGSTPIDPDSSDPLVAKEPDSLVQLRGRASRLLWLASPQQSGFFAWNPNSRNAELVATGSTTARRLRLPGEPLDMQAPAAGEGQGVAALFRVDNGPVSAAAFTVGAQEWKTLVGRDALRIGLSPDGKQLGVATGEKLLLRMTLPDGRTVERTALPRDGSVEHLVCGNRGELWTVSTGPFRVGLVRDGRMVTTELGFEGESAALPASGRQLFCAGDRKDRLLVIRHRGSGDTSDRLAGKEVELPIGARGRHALALSLDGKHVAVLHHAEKSISFVHGSNLERTVTLPLSILGGNAFSSGGKTSAAAVSPDGRVFAFASDLGLCLLEAQSCIV